jgi:hypothetical protein
VNSEARGAGLVLAGQTAAGPHVCDGHGAGRGGCGAEQAGEGRLHGHQADKQDRDGMEEPLHALQWSIDGIGFRMCAEIVMRVLIVSTDGTERTQKTYAWH